MLARASISTLLAVVLITACANDGPTGVDDDLGTAADQVVLDGQIAASSIVIEFPAGPVIPGASAWMARSEGGVNVRLQTSGLTPGHAYTLWVVPFNNPENCIVANACVLAATARRRRGTTPPDVPDHRLPGVAFLSGVRPDPEGTRKHLDSQAACGANPAGSTLLPI